MDKKLQSKYNDHPLAQAILEEGLAIQDRFSAKPVYGPTGKGMLKSEGVSEIERAKRKVDKASTAK
jgi:hypothetical protein